MTRRLYHPLWAHLPAAVLTVTTVYNLWLARGKMPAQVPMHFDFAGRVDRFGSPNELWLIPGLMLFYLAISVLGDEVWARSEQRKTFNWLSLLDELLIGFMAGLLLGLLPQLIRGVATLRMPWDNIAITVGVAVIGAAMLESVRPFILFPRPTVTEDPNRLRKEIAARMAAPGRWVYWEAQNPAWMNAALFASSSLTLAFAAFAVIDELPWMALLLAPLGILQVLLLGGMRVLVTREQVEVRIGLAGWRVFRIALPDIADLSVRSFSALGEFGGYGIRWNLTTTAYFWRGNRGVQLRSARGRQFLLGSDRPEYLAAVIEAAREVAIR